MSTERFMRHHYGASGFVPKGQHMQPTIGRIVIYKLSEGDLNRLKARPSHETNPHSIGQELPLLACRVWPNEWGEGKAGINGQVFLDGSDTLWVTSVGEGTGEGQWHWPERV